MNTTLMSEMGSVSIPRRMMSGRLLGGEWTRRKHSPGGKDHKGGENEFYDDRCQAGRVIAAALREHADQCRTEKCPEVAEHVEQADAPRGRRAAQER